MAIELFSNSLYSDANLVAYYRLEDLTDAKGGSSWTNSGATSVAGKFNNGYDFESGSSTFMKMALPAGVKVANPTFHAWFNMESTGGTHVILAGTPKGTTADGRGFTLRVTTTGLAQVRKGEGDGSFTTLSGVTTMSTGIWYMLDATYDGSTLKIYLNGRLDNSVSDAVAIDWTDNVSGVGPDPAQLYLGGDRNNTAGTDANINFADGIIDDVAIFSRALTDAEIYSLYTSTKTINGVPLANLKTWNGVALNQIKTFNGLA